MDKLCLPLRRTSISFSKGVLLRPCYNVTECAESCNAAISEPVSALEVSPNCNRLELLPPALFHSQVGRLAQNHGGIGFFFCRACIGPFPRGPTC
jgi:hypothetical protein